MWRLFRKGEWRVSSAEIATWTAADGSDGMAASAVPGETKTENALPPPPPSPRPSLREWDAEQRLPGMDMAAYYRRKAQEAQEALDRVDKERKARQQREKEDERTKEKDEEEKKEKETMTPLQEEVMAGKQSVADYARDVQGAFYSLHDLATQQVFAPSARATRNMTAMERRPERLRTYGSIYWEAKKELPDGSGKRAAERSETDRMVRKIETRQRAMSLPPRQRISGVYMVKSPTGGIVRVTDTGQHVGGILMERHEQFKKEEEAIKQAEAEAAYDALNITDDTPLDEIIAKIREASLKVSRSSTPETVTNTPRD